MASIIEEANKDLATIANRIEKVEDYLNSAEAKLDFNTKTLVQVAKDHPNNLFQASKWLNEMKILEDFVNVKAKTIESEHWKRYNEKHGRALTTRDIQAYIAGEPNYVAMLELQLEIAYIKAQVQALYDALKDMSYQIKNVTELLVNQLQDAIV